MNTSESIQKLERHDMSLYGKDGQLGVEHKVNIIWKSYVWLIALASAVLGGCISHFFHI